MNLTKLMQLVNAKLAGELFTYPEMEAHLDAAIDDINGKLNSTFPVFSDFTAEAYPQYPNYNFFPDKYLRSVVVSGAATKFYAVDEEGALTAPAYIYEFRDNLFYMVRDYIMYVPLEYQAVEAGFFTADDEDSQAENMTGTSQLFSV